MNISIQLIKDKRVISSDTIKNVDWDTREMYSKLSMIARLDDYEIEEINLLLDKFIMNRI